MNLTKPLFKSTRTPHQRDDLDTFDVYKPAYLNAACSRCSAPKKIATASAWCPTCSALPLCDMCEEPTADCTCEDFVETCTGCEYGCWICTPSKRRYSHSSDRERFGFDG